MSPARRTAFEVLAMVERGAKSDAALIVKTKELEARDAGLATQIVYGVLRRRAQLDWLIGQASARPPEKLDAAVLRALRMGAFQLRFLDRVPAHAAVAESVELVRRAGLGWAAGFVNAVLRRLPSLPAKWPSEEIEYSTPAWLLERWKRRLGPELALAAARYGLEEPPAAERGGRPMDEGSQAIVPLLELRPGELFLDVCAAPGNKTLQALEARVRAVACDVSLKRLRNFLAPCPRVAADAATGLPFGAVFDRILVDAPCTGTGTLARNPEIRWRVTPEEILRQAARQEAILREALRCLKPGGRLVYSTCSLEAEENEDVVARVCPDRVRSTLLRVPGRDPGDGFFAAVIE
ncbi:MAG: transcription antitermination factor NusB [Bryobacteraceae bacterium]